jgi:hypothetical protein
MAFGMHIEIFTDHKTLLNFDTQKELSRQQARWMEFLSRYQYHFNYVSGSLNMAADTLSCIHTPEMPTTPDRLMVACTLLADSPPSLGAPPSLETMAVQLDLGHSLLEKIQSGYEIDAFASKV